MIKVIKSGEEKQKTALTGKQTIEKIKSATKGKSLDVSSENVDLGNIMFEVSKNEDDVNFKKKIIYLDGNYETLPSEANARYEEVIELIKAKATDEDNNKIDINLDNKRDVVDKNKIKKDNIIKCKFNLIREKDSRDVIIRYMNEDNDNEKSLDIPNVSHDKLSINVYIENEGNKKKVTIKDSEGKSIEVTSEKMMTKEDDNRLEIYLNFNQYNKADEEKPIEVKVFNKEEKANNSATTIICEKSKDIEVNVKPVEGDIFFGDNRSDSSETTELGSLYNINVTISKINDNKVLFEGHSNQNIVISK